MRLWVHWVVLWRIDSISGSSSTLRGRGAGGDPVVDLHVKRQKEILCSKRVLAHTVYCPENEAPVPPSFDARGGNLYPTKEGFHSAVKSGKMCQLPAPFMSKDLSGRCCIPRNGDEHVWPNFCANRDELIGSAKRHKYIRELDMTRSSEAEGVHLPKGVYVLGRPDLPINYDMYHTSYIMMGVYVLITMVCLSFAVYVVQRLRDEDAIVKGKSREDNLYNVTKSSAVGMNLTELSEDEEISEEEDDFSESEASSVSPAQKSIARSNNQIAASVGQVSMSFGLLPGLPRGRSTNNSTLNSPRLTARERREFVLPEQ